MNNPAAGIWGQVGQDVFIRTVLKEKRNGVYVEIGTHDPVGINNTYPLESILGWRGILVEYDKSFENKYKETRPNSYVILEDATKVDWNYHFEKANIPNDVDYLQIDLEVNNRSTLTTLEELDRQVFDRVRFATVTFEHDIYSGDYFNTRAKSREIFQRRGYVRVFSDVQNIPSNTRTYPFEDWYVHPELVDMDFVNTIKREESLPANIILDLLQGKK
jgi:hypothetical protein